jgi:Lrp/AsnC family transcriptional regulator, regulator for asnA, asnC and gidA
VCDRRRNPQIETKLSHESVCGRYKKNDFRRGESFGHAERWQDLSMSQPGTIDALSKKIIEQLQEDGRRSYVEIGRAVGLSEAAVRQRVQRLTESGAMQVVAVTDPMQLGFHRQAMIGLRVSGDTRSVAAELEKMSAVDYLVLTAGSFDILAEVVCESDDDLVELLNSRIRSLPGVISSETFVYLGLRKQSYDWGTR